MPQLVTQRAPNQCAPKITGVELRLFMMAVADCGNHDADHSGCSAPSRSSKIRVALHVRNGLVDRLGFKYFGISKKAIVLTTELPIRMVCQRLQCCKTRQ